VQTCPLWISIVLGFRQSSFAKWAALPCFVFWLLIMTAIWLYLLGWAHLLSGTFSPIEIAMTVVVGAASVAGIITALRIRRGVRAWPAAAMTLLLVVLQVAAFRLSFLPKIAHR